MSPFHRIFSQIHPSSNVLAACVGGIAAAHIYEVCGSSREESKYVNSTSDCNSYQEISSSDDQKTERGHHSFQLNSSSVCTPNLQLQHPIILASSPSDVSSPSRSNIHKNNIIDCDYVVIGHGRAGQSAVRTLKSLDPSAEIVIIDPNNKLKSKNEPAKRRRSGAVQHLPTRATFIDHSQKVVRISPIQSPTSESHACNVHYRKSMLLATGTRGAPPPEECIGPDTKSRILELRSTSVPIIDNKGTEHKKRQQQPPILDPSTVRSLSLMAASQGATVAVMGSSFEALELAASLARASPKVANDADDNLKVQLLFGNSGPLSSRLPRYLSAAITKRLRQSGIDVEERSMTRYLSMENSTAIPRLELYTLKSYDRLDSRRLVSDLLVLAPSVGGMSGTAVLPVANEDTAETSNNYQPWSSLVTPSLLTCYLEDGRVATNPEFLAASSIYAAGSVAKYPNRKTGQADIAGGDHMSAELSGEIAARNMVKEASNGNKGRHEFEFMPCHVQETIPIWRSDQVAYRSTDNAHEASTLALYSMGIHALCVGKCDSTSMATHGFWWTNTNNQSDSKRDVDSTTSVRPNSFMRRITRRATNFTSKGSFTRGGALPVYGSGVVYYLDQCGSIQGVMLWGLPFSKDSSNVRTSINDSLVERMQEIIRTNGGIVIRDHSDNIVKESYGVTMDVDLLSYLHLAEESKHLASTALKGSVNSNSNTKIVLGRPLHRYTPWKSSEMTNLGKVRRKDDAGQIAGVNDLFYSTSNDADTSLTTHWTNEPIRPPSLKRIYTMQGEATWLANAESIQLQQERSRPSKEDPLWLRQTEEYRYINKKESMANEFIANMLSGQFSDGSEAVKQAPVPKIYLDAKERIRSWTAGDDDEDGIEEG